MKFALREFEYKAQLEDFKKFNKPFLNITYKWRKIPISS